MELHIFSQEQAHKHVPSVPTYAIRIFSLGDEPRNREWYALPNSPNWVATPEYVFDDAWPEDFEGEFGLNPTKHRLITPDIADKIISDFAQKIKQSEALLVHCSRGRNRSPAVGIALNEIFNLGNDTAELKAKYREATWFAYEMLIERACQIMPGGTQ